MTSHIFEAIIGGAETPKQFWLVVDIPNWKPIDDAAEKRSARLLSDLGRGELEGVRGISDSKEILTSWWMVGRNAAIYMNVDKVVALNDLEKIRYDDPEYLARDNLAALYRLYDKERRAPNDHQGLMHNIMQQVRSQLAKEDQMTGHLFDHYGFVGALGDAWSKEQHHVNSVEDFARETYSMISRLSKISKWHIDDLLKRISPQLWNSAITEAFLYIGRLYADEAEWIIHSSSLKIPPKSLMLVGVDFATRAKYDEWIEAARPGDLDWERHKWRLENYDRLQTAIQRYNLDQYYTIRYVDSKKFEELRSTVTVRRRNRTRS